MADRPLPLASDSDPSLAPPAPRTGSAAALPARVLVSACLLGEKVRYDGQAKRDGWVVESLGRFVRLEPICPEVACGMPVPRPSMHLVGDPEHPRLIASRSGADLTGQMVAFCRRRVAELEGLELCGYICKKDSPSSGMERVRVYDESGACRRVGVGLFTRAFREQLPFVPVEEEGRLRDEALRQSFLERVFCLHRFRELERGGRTRGRLVAFHTAHKLLLLTHGQAPYRALGQLVARAREMPTPELYRRYLAGFTAALQRPAGAGRVVNVLMHALGYFKSELSGDEKRELLELFETYRRGLAPLAVPMTLMRHYVRKFRPTYLRGQVLLEPFPAELLLHRP